MSQIVLPLIRNKGQLLSNVFKRGLSNNVLNQKYPVGKVIHGFQINKVEQLKELEATAVKLRHLQTGADYLHLDRNDTNNVFGVGFKTIPKDSTGVAHILEHTVLCGSEKYPVRDPFFKMLNRSLSTFMNAMTGFDYTIYPFSTQNPRDFSNLMSVYLDAVFFPNVDPRDFRQEGWRLENELVEDKNSPIVFKGIVYNEMKGALAETNDLFFTRMFQNMLPGTTYEHVSGGDPPNILDLTYEQLKNFHQTFYHPSNSYFFTYGNLELEKHLKQINDTALSRFQKSASNTSIGEVKKFNSPKTVTIECPPDPMVEPDKQIKMSLSFLTNEINDINETFAMKILGSLLTDGQNSPMYQALIQSQIGSNFTAGTG